jgi:hypothetical protein
MTLPVVTVLDPHDRAGPPVTSSAPEGSFGHRPIREVRRTSENLLTLSSKESAFSQPAAFRLWLAGLFAAGSMRGKRNLSDLLSDPEKLACMISGMGWAGFGTLSP